METKRITKLKDSLLFLLPRRVIKKEHLSKKDVKSIKASLLESVSYIFMVVAFLLLIVFVFLYFYMSVTAEGEFIEYYGVPAIIGLTIGFSGTFISLTLFLIAKAINKDKVGTILSRIGADILFASISLYMLLCIYGDAVQGFTSQSKAISASIIYIAVIMIIQCPYWIDAITLNSLTGISLVVLAFHLKIHYNFQGEFYYAVVGLLYPLFAHVISALLFYVQSRHYRDTLEKERLTNTAYYDSLTHCKNRYALDEFVTETFNLNHQNILMIIFDIDDFKLYNDKFSHLVGDYCLKSIAEAIRKEFPSPNLDFFRFGGEEFLLFFELRNPNDARIVIEQVRKAVKNLKIKAPEGAPSQYVTISLGGLLIGKIDEDFKFERALNEVDHYLYHAKDTGKDISCLNGIIIHN